MKQGDCGSLQENGVRDVDSGPRLARNRELDRGQRRLA